MNSVIQKIIDNNLRYNLAIAGPIGSGKTTLCNYIWDRLNSLNLLTKDDQTRENLLHYYKEWIDHSDTCKQMLVNRTNGLISRFTLQSFILDEWNNILTKEPLRNFNLFERSISECSMCFCEDLSFKQYDVLHSMEYEIACKYDIPCVDRDFGFTISENTETHAIYDELVKQIAADVDFMILQKLNSFNRIFGMKILDAETLVGRIGKRARPGEEDLQIKRMNDHISIFKRAYTKFGYRSRFNIDVPTEEENVHESPVIDESLTNGC